LQNTNCKIGWQEYFTIINYWALYKLKG